MDGDAYHLYHLDFDPLLTSGPHITADDEAAQRRNLQRLHLYRQTRTAVDVRRLTAGYSPWK
jgi:hypothetical protein